MIPAASESTPPAAGAPLEQVAVAGAISLVAMGVLFVLVRGHLTGRIGFLAWASDLSARIGRLPGWAALPSGLAAVALFTALVGVYWDIGIHIDEGRDDGPLANPAHYLLLLGLDGIFAAGVLAVTLPRGERPGPAAVRIAPGLHAPVGGVLLLLCASFALAGFPLDDLWHRLFGQDVTLWGPTHLMMIGGAVATLVAIAVLIAEGVRARDRAARRRPPGPALWMMRIAPFGGLLIGLELFLAEFDWGVPQYRQLWHPVLLAASAALTLTAARVWAGRGGALAAGLFYLTLRGPVGLAVSEAFGQTAPALPLFLAEVACVELAALVLGARRRALAFGAAAGLGCGTAGFAAEYGWSQVTMPLPWTSALLPEGLLLAAAAGAAAGALGGLLGAGLRGRLPVPGRARAACAGAFATLLAVGAIASLETHPSGIRATVTLEELRPAPEREVAASVRIEPSSAARGAEWVSLVAWQGGGLVVEALEERAGGLFRTSEPIPVHGSWKSLIRLQRGRALLGVPIYLPADPAIPAPEVSAPGRFTRALVDEERLLQRERRRDVPGWLWPAAAGLVLLAHLLFMAGFCAGVGRVARRDVVARPATTAAAAAA